MATVPKAQGKVPEESDTSWTTFALEEKQKEAERLEETAKFLVGIISISLTIFISNRPESYTAWAGQSFQFATALWMLSALFSFGVLFPWRYGFHEESPDSIQSAYQKIVRYKRWILIASVLFFLAALGIAAHAFANGIATSPID